MNMFSNFPFYKFDERREVVENMTMRVYRTSIRFLRITTHKRFRLSGDHVIVNQYLYDGVYEDMYFLKDY